MKLRLPRQTLRRTGFRAAIKNLSLAGVTAGAVLGGSLTALADAADFWTGTVGDFGDPNQWSLARVPVTPAPDGSGNDNANVFNGGTVLITTDGLVPNDVNAGGTGNGTTGDGTYTQTAGSMSIGSGSGWFRLGTTSGTTGTYNLQGGTLTFGNSPGAQMNVGEVLGGTGVFNQSGGTFTINTMDRANFGSAGGTGTLNLSGGSFINSTDRQVTIGDGNDTGQDTGASNGSVGIFNLSGTGIFDGNGQVWVGEYNNASGTLNMTGGTLNMHNWLAIGRQSANGTVNLSAGTINMDASANPGSHITLAGVDGVQTGIINMSGGALNVATGGGAIWVGENGTGIVNVSGGTITANDGIVLGENGGTGTLTLQNGTDATGPLANGGGKEVVTTPTVTLGSDNVMNNFQAATLNLNGGTLAVNGIVAGAGTGTKLVNFNGGTLQATADNPDMLGGSSVNAVVGTGGATIDTNGHAVTIPEAFVSGGAGDGGLTKLGTGTLTLAGLSGYVGPTTVNAGVLAINGSVGSAGAPAGTVTVAAAGALTGTGLLRLGASNVTINGVLAAGATASAGDPNTLTVTTTGTLTLANTARTQFDIVTAANKDLFMLNGAKLTLGGTLALNLGNGVGLGTYTLFSGLAAAPSGVFTNVTGLPAGDGAAFTYVATGGNYNLVIAAIPEPSTWALGVFGLAGLAAVVRRRRTA